MERGKSPLKTSPRLVFNGVNRGKGNWKLNFQTTSAAPSAAEVLANKKPSIVAGVGYYFCATRNMPRDLIPDWETRGDSDKRVLSQTEVEVGKARRQVIGKSYVHLI